MSMVPGNQDEQLSLLLTSDVNLGVESLLRLHGGKVSGYLKRRFPTFDDATIYDALVDAVMVFRSTFDPQKSSAGGWLLLLAHQQAVNRLRGKRQATTSLDRLAYEPPARLEAPDASLDYAETVAGLEQAMSELSDLERSVIEADLDAGGAASAKVLGEQFQLPERSIYAARARARQKLMQRLTRPS